MSGTYTVLAHENPAIMSSASFGLPATAPDGYAPEKIYYATKISVDGIYLHELDTTVWAQGHQDLSHGCLNLNYDNASWYFKLSRIGDPVEVKNTTGPSIQQWQNGDWSVPWSTWVKGSALH
jgi:lipoprotein-anchoring transpeptidase ErfK/SrfK